MSSFLSFNLTIISTTIAMLSTILGAACVLFSKNNLNIKHHKIFLGFTSGLMISSSIWSLLLPATQLLNNNPINLISITSGFILGTLSLKSIDRLMSSIISKNKLQISSSLKKKYLIISSSALRNLIEGISIGIAFSLISSQDLKGSLGGAITLSLSMILQNFPEGFSLSMPLKNENLSSIKSFLIGSFPGVFEPIGGVIGIILSNKIVNFLPLMLSFAAGAIIITVVDELIPEYSLGKHKNYGTIGFISGFILLLILETILK